MYTAGSSRGLHSIWVEVLPQMARLRSGPLWDLLLEREREGLSKGTTTTISMASARAWARWIMEQLHSVQGPQHGWAHQHYSTMFMQRSRLECWNVDCRQVHGRAHWSAKEGSYVQVPIGRDGQDRVVMEGAHRLACWLRDPYRPSSSSVVQAQHNQHLGRTNKCRRAVRCANPHHLAWGDHAENKREADQRALRGQQRRLGGKRKRAPPK